MVFNLFKKGSVESELFKPKKIAVPATPFYPTPNGKKPVSKVEPFYPTPTGKKPSVFSVKTEPVKVFDLDKISNTLTNIGVPKPDAKLFKINKSPVDITFADIAQLPSFLLGKFVVQPAFNLFSSAVELKTGKPGPKLKLEGLTKSTGNLIDSKSYQQKYFDLIDSGVPEKDAYKETLITGFFDALSVVPELKGLSKSTILATKPTALIKPEIKESLSKQTLFDYFSGRKNAKQLGISEKAQKEITERMKAMNPQEKTNFLQGFDVLDAEPSFVGKMFGVGKEEAQKILKQSYGGLVRESSAGALPGTIPKSREPAFGLSIREVENVGGASKPTKNLLSGIEDDIPKNVADDAYRGTSFDPEKRGTSAIKEYVETLKDDYEELLKLADTPEKKTILDDSFSRYREGYKNRTLGILNAHSRTISPMISGRGNFPVARNNKRIDSEMNKVGERIEFREKVLKKIKNEINPTIFKGTSEKVISEMDSKLAELKKEQERMKSANKIIFKDGELSEKTSKLKELGFSDKEVVDLVAGDFMNRKGFPSYQLTSINLKIKTLEKRVAETTKKREIANTTGNDEYKIGDITISKNFDENRLQVTFVNIPDLELRAKLKAKGFRWSPKNQAWQRILTNQAEKDIKSILGQSNSTKALDSEVLETSKKLEVPKSQPLDVEKTMPSKKVAESIEEAKEYGYDIDFINKAPKDYAGKHFPSSKKIEIYTKGRTPEQIQNTLDHEIGHVVDYQRRGIVADPMGDSVKGYDGKLKPASDSDIYFRDSRLKEAEAIRKEIPKIHTASNTQKEIYADAFVLFKRSPEKLKEIAPRIYKEISDFKKGASESEVATKNTAQAVEDAVVRAKAGEDFGPRNNQAIPEELEPFKNTGSLEAVEKLIVQGKVRVVSRDGKDVFQVKKGNQWVNARDSESAVKQVIEGNLPKPKVYQPADQQKIDLTKERLANVRDQLEEHPGKILQKIVDRKEGQIEELRNPNRAKTPAEKQRIIAKNKRFTDLAMRAVEGTPWSDDFDNVDTLRDILDQYKDLRQVEKSIIATRNNLEKTLVPIPRKPSVNKEILKVEKVDPLDVTEGEGRSLEILSDEARNIINDEPFPMNVALHDVLEKTVTNVKNKVNVLDTYLRTPDKVMKKIGFEKEADLLRDGADAYWKELPKNIEKISVWLKRLKNKEAQEAVFDWLDGKAVTLPTGEKEVAIEIKEWLREWAKRLDLPEEDTIKHYITHVFSDELIQKEFDEDLAKIITDKIPKETYDPFLQERLGVKGYKRDLGLALDAYVKRATRKVHMDPALEAINDKAGSSLEFTHLEKSQFNYLKKYVENIQMRPGDFEEGLDNFLKSSMIGYRLGQRPTIRILNFFRQQAYRGGLGLNLASAVRNLSQGINTYAELGEKYTTLGYLKLFDKGAMQELQREGVLNAGFIQDRALSSGKKAIQALDKGLFFFFEQAEKLNRGSAYFGAKAKGLSQGMTQEEAIKYGKKIVRKTQFVFDPVDTPVGIANPIAKTLLQFQTFTVKQIEFLTGLAKGSVKGDDKIKNLTGLIRYAIAGLVFTYTIGKAIGMEPKQLLPWFRFDIPASMKFIVESVKAGVDAPDKYGNDRSTAKKVKDVSSAGIGLLPGGNQIKKTLQGRQTIKDGGVYTKGGSLQFLQGDSLAENLQTLLFGKYASGTAREYFNGESAGDMEFERLKKLPKEERDAKVKEYKENNPSLYEKIKKASQDEKLGLTKEDKKIRDMGVSNGERADYIFKKTQKLKTKEEKNAYLKDLAKKKIIFFDKYVEGPKAGQYKNETLKQIIKLIKAEKEVAD